MAKACRTATACHNMDHMRCSKRSLSCPVAVAERHRAAKVCCLKWSQESKSGRKKGNEARLESGAVRRASQVCMSACEALPGRRYIRPMLGPQPSCVSCRSAAFSCTQRPRCWLLQAEKIAAILVHRLDSGWHKDTGVAVGWIRWRSVGAC